MDRRRWQPIARTAAVGRRQGGARAAAARSPLSRALCVFCLAFRNPPPPTTHNPQPTTHTKTPKTPKNSISVTFVDKDGTETTVRAPLGKSLLEVAHDNDVELEGACNACSQGGRSSHSCCVHARAPALAPTPPPIAGPTRSTPPKKTHNPKNPKNQKPGACEGSLACSTCHVILEPDVYAKLEEPCEDELDMLDLAFGLTPTSRLGCQVLSAPALDGMRVRLPSATRNFYVGEEGGEGEGAAKKAEEKGGGAVAVAAGAAAPAK